jgi:putative DNA primase/helicase
MQVPLDFPGVTVVISLAGAVGRRCMIQPKELDSAWVVVPNLWGALIARSGFLKSPLIKAITKPLADIEAQLQKQNHDVVAEHHRELRQWKDSKGKPDVGEKPCQPPEKRIIINDSTFEKLHEIMRENPAGVFVIRDELTGWLAELDRAGREGERAFFLSAWAGDTGHTIDRIGRGSIYVPACCLSMLGGIQPERLRSYLTGTSGVPLPDDGLIQRFQLIAWPDTSAGYEYVDRPPDRAALDQAERIFERLTQLDPEKAPRFRFSPDAQELFVAWFEGLETRLRGDDLPAVMLSHLSKYRSLMPSLALLFELADLAAGGSVGSVGFLHSPHLVTSENTERAYHWCFYLESHAWRVYASAETPAQTAAKEMARKIMQGGPGSEFTPRQVVQKGWRGLDSTKKVTEACDVLAKAHWLRSHKQQTGGRPSLLFDVNPKVEGLEETDASER